MSLIGFKIPLEVDEQTAIILDGQSKICNWLYNRLLEQANELKVRFITSDGQDKEAARTVYTRHGLRDLVPQLKVEHPFLKSVYSSPLKNAALRLSRAIREYQKSRQGKRPGPKIEWPHFRSWKGKWFSLEYDEPWKGYELDGHLLTLTLGIDRDGKRLQSRVKLVDSFPYAHHQVKTLRIVKDHGRFFAVFTVDKSLPSVSDKPLKIIALDPNHKNLAYGVGTDGQAIEIENMPNLKALDRRIDQMKAKRDRCKRKSKLITFIREDGSIHRHWEPSRRWYRYNQVLQRLYRQRREQTKTYLYTVANALCRQYDLIAVGDYTPRGGGISTGMRRAMNNQSLIGRFKKVMAWVAEKSGRLYLEYNESGTTRTCSDCQTVVAGGIEPEMREWMCPECYSIHIRDENAGQNGLRRVRKILVSGSDHRPVEIQARCTWRVTPTGVVSLPGGVAA
jgi:putative transposase